MPSLLIYILLVFFGIIFITLSIFVVEKIIELILIFVLFILNIIESIKTNNVADNEHNKSQALSQWLAREHPELTEFDLCACRGKDREDLPACKCNMRNYEKVNGSWYHITKSPDGEYSAAMVTGPLV